MKSKQVLILGLLTVASGLPAFAQAPDFTYQGQLNDGAAPASGLYDLRFALFDAESGGAQQGNTHTNEATVVSSGLFTVTLGLGDVPFNGDDRWLEIGVRTNGGGAFATLSPRQRITATPYATTAASVTGPIHGSGIADGTITGAKLASGAVGTTQLAANAITASNLVAGAAAENLTVSGLAAVPGGGMILSSNLVDTNLTASGYVNMGRVGLGDFWELGSSANGPTPRRNHTAVWTGSELIVWGGQDGVDSSTAVIYGSGGRYNPATDMWTPVSTSNAPAARTGHTAIWTGSEMIIWGGNSNSVYFNNGARYHPATDTWTAISGSGAPADGRRGHTAVWTGTEMIIWGGRNASALPNDGWRYNPVSDVWTTIPGSLPLTPSQRAFHTAVWTGSEMIIWGGEQFDSTGGCYNPLSNSWTATTITGAPPGRLYHTAVWTGDEMIIFGGNVASMGGRYHRASNVWTTIPTNGFPTTYLERHTAVWDGSAMIVWGGHSGSTVLNTGGRYNPTINTWSPTSASGVPAPRLDHTAVWTGSRMVVFGGRSTFSSSSPVFGDVASYSKPAVSYAWAAQTSGSYTSAVTFVNLTNQYVGPFVGDGNGLTNLNPANLTPGLAAISISGNAATATVAASLAGSLSGDVTGTQAATVVTSVGGQSAANVAAAASAANAATSLNTPNTLVKRDPSGAFNAGDINAGLITGDGGGLTNLNAASLTGNVADARLSANIPRLNGANQFNETNIFTGALLATNSNSRFAGDGAGLVNLSANQLTGTLPVGSLPAIAVTNGAASVALTGTFSGNGAGLSNVTAATLGGLSAASFWQLGGNTGTTAGTHFVGTTDNQPLELRVNGQRALRLQPGSFGGPILIGGETNNVVELPLSSVTIGGGSGNTIRSNSTGTVIAGGNNHLAEPFSLNSVISGGANNAIGSNAWYGTVAGGLLNNIGAGAIQAVVGGGRNNTIGNNSDNSVIAGGQQNSISNQASFNVIGGGGDNSIGTNSSGNVIGGGTTHQVSDNVSSAMVGGGSQNRIAAGGNYATIPGGRQNEATNYAFAAGRRAKALHQGAFVWADSQNADFASTLTNQFNVRAGGGVRLETGGAGATLDGQPILITGSGGVVDAQLTANVALLNRASQTFTGTNIFTQRVGIGTTSPAADLHVRGSGTNGALIITPNVSDSQSQILLAENQTASLGFIIRNAGNEADNPLHFIPLNAGGVAGAPQFTLERNGGNVGIGTNNPSARLHLGGVPGTDGIKFPDGSLQTRAVTVLRATSVLIDAPSMAAGTAINYGVSVPGATPGSVAMASSQTNLGTGIIVGPVSVFTNDLVTITVQNLSPAAINPPATYFSVAVIP